MDEQHRELAGSALPLGERAALVLNYYQPWTYAGSERFLQLAREELRRGRGQAFVYVADAGLRGVLDRTVLAAEYARLALYEFVPDNRARPVSPYAVRLTGSDAVAIDELAERLRPAYVRAHYPATEFLPALETPALRQIPFIYDLMDLWSEFAHQPWGDSDVEAYYVKRADALVSVSRLLIDRFAGATPGHLVPNAVDPLFLTEIANRPGTRPFGAAKRVLYMGGMAGSWFDWDTVRALPRELPDHDFTFLGSLEPPPEEADAAHLARCRAYRAELSALPNVRFHDEVPHDELVPWLHGADVGLIPFRACDLVTAVSPLKVYEYLGAGMPVVQSGMPDVEDYPGVRTARDVPSFVSHVRAVDRESLTADEAAEIARFAAANTWSHTVTTMDRIVAALR